MSGETDRESKTEEPTEKRLQDAIDKGNVPLSREIVTFGSLVTILLVAVLMATPMLARVLNTLAVMFMNAGQTRLESREDATHLGLSAVYHTALAIIPVMAVISAGGLLASLFQNMPQANIERIKPQASRLSPSAGLKRLLGFSGLSEFGKSVAKLAAVGLVATLMVRSELNDVIDTLLTDPHLLAETMRALGARVIVALLLVAMALGIADLWLARFKWRRDLRMTRQDIKDEYKQAEGDPQLIEQFAADARRVLKPFMDHGENFVLVTAPEARPYVRMIADRLFPNLAVLSHVEIARGIRVEAIGSLS